MGTSKYPRPGQRIAPSALAEVLDVPLPPEFGCLAAGCFKKLADLDETIWRHASKTVCITLASLVLQQVKQHLPQVKNTPLPHLLHPLAPSALEVDIRTFNCLVHRFDKDLQALNKLCVSDLLKQRNFGVYTLVDLLVALESVTAGPHHSRQLELALHRETEA
jgi:hypothetical protein